jgi:hypothetical protein
MYSLEGNRVPNYLNIFLESTVKRFIPIKNPEDILKRLWLFFVFFVFFVEYRFF